MKSGRTVEPTLGLAWYRAEQWPRLLEVSSDREELEETHDEWMSGAKKTLRNFLIEGVNAIKVDVDVDDLIRGCKERGFEIDGSSRATYVAQKVRLPRGND